MKFSFPTEIPIEGEPLRLFLKAMVDEIRRFSDRNIDMRQNAKVTQVTVTTAAADTEVTVNHNLGVTPFMYIANVDNGGIIYDSRRSDWGINQIFIKCSTATATVQLLVMA